MFFIKMNSKIQSTLTRPELIRKLYKITDLSNKNNNLFVGQVSDNGFKIYKKPKEYLRNAFTSILVGKIENKNEGCDINITAKLNLFTALFFLIWSIGTIIVPLIIGFVEPVFFIMPLVASAILIILLVFAFYQPAKRDLRLLNSLLISD